MLRTILLLLIAVPGYAAIHCIGTPTLAAVAATCTTTDADSSANLQTRISAAADGDTILVHAGSIYTSQYISGVHSQSNPVTIMTDRYPWLPCADCRITPADEPNTAYIVPQSYGITALVGQQDGSQNGPQGWKFVGITFWMGNGKGANFDGTTYVGDALISNGGSQTDFAYIFSGSGTTSGSTSGASSTITVTGTVQANWLGQTLQIMETGANWINGSYIITSINIGASQITLDRAVSTGAAASLGLNRIVGSNGSFITWLIRDSANEPAYWTFDRCMLRIDDTERTTPVQYTHGFRLNGHGNVIKNSFVWPLTNGIETHATISLTGSCPLGINSINADQYTNNHLSAAGITFFKGGADSDYDDGAQSCTIVRYNYSMKPYKYWPGYVDTAGLVNCTAVGVPSATCVASNNPQPTYFSARPRLPICMKNLGEWKSSNDSIIEYNVFDTVWSDNFCQGQHFGMTVSPRDLTDTYTGFSATSGSSAFTYASLQGYLYWKPSGVAGAAWSNWPNNLSICVVKVATNSPLECHFISSWDPATLTGSISPETWSANYSSVTSYVSRDWFYIRNMAVRNNLFRNNDMLFSILFRDGWPGHDAVAGKEDYSRIRGLSITNNVAVNTINMNALGEASSGSRMFHLQTMQNPLVGVGAADAGGNYIMEHNSFHPMTGLNTVKRGWDLVTNLSQPNVSNSKIINFSMNNNSLPEIYDDGGNYYSWPNGDSGFGNRWCNFDDAVSGTRYLINNYAPFSLSGNVYGACNITQTGNIPGALTGGLPAYVPGTTAQVLPGNDLWKTASDGADMGAVSGKVPAIIDLRVIPAQRTASLRFSTTAPISDVGNTQPCVLEVSSNEDLVSYLSHATVTNDLNPSYFLQPNASSRTNAALPAITITGSYVVWPIGASGSAVVGDDGLPHDLRLAANTQYWGRLQCYGDTQTFTFTTLP